MIDVTKMQPFQLRVVEEKEELDKKMVSLRKFIESGKGFKMITENEQIMLYRQYRIMGEYSLTLLERICNFKEIK